MIILGIETSCDETGVALIETREEAGIFECRVISSLIHSQAELHSPYGGVFPTLAKREHEKNLPILLQKILTEAGFPADKPPIDLVAVTEGPGLEPALWTGILFADTLSRQWHIPLVPINHMEGHVVGSLLKDDTPNGSWQSLKPLKTPALAFLISGGHTELVTVETENPSRADSSHSLPHLLYTIIGQTRDDAVGEAFDKVARLLGLPYPGGPRLSVLAEKARESGMSSSVKLPRPMISSKDLNFSFSGLKTAVLYAVLEAEKNSLQNGTLSEEFKAGLAREFEDAVVETLDAKLRKALDVTGAQTIIIGGGVSANKLLREQCTKIAHEYGALLYMPSRHISGDNALMIALAGAFNASSPARTLKAHGTKKLGI
jgi:N6-L-threonylcarbamoyladenine synthase